MESRSYALFRDGCSTNTHLLGWGWNTIYTTGISTSEYKSFNLLQNNIIYTSP